MIFDTAEIIDLVEMHKQPLLLLLPWHMVNRLIFFLYSFIHGFLLSSITITNTPAIPARTMAIFTAIRVMMLEEKGLVGMNISIL